MIGRVPKELWMEVHNTVQETGIKNIPKKKKSKENGCLVLEKAEEPEIKLPTYAGSSEKQESFRKTSTSALLTMPKPLTT